MKGCDGMYRKKIAPIIWVIFILISTSIETGAIEKKHSYNYILNFLDDERDNYEDVLSPYNIKLTETNSIAPIITTSQMTRDLKYNNQKIGIQLTGYKEEVNSEMFALFPVMDPSTLGKVNYQNNYDGSTALNINENINGMDQINISFQSENLKDTYSSSMIYNHRFGENTTGLFMIDVDEDKNFSSLVGIEHDLGWSNIGFDYYQNKSDDPGEYSFNWKQKSTFLPGTPLLYSFSAGTFRDSEEQWSQNTKLVISHQPFMFGENNMIIFSLKGEMNWQENNKSVIGGNMSLILDQKLSLNASISKTNTSLSNGDIDLIASNVGVSANITDNLKSQIFYSFMENEKLLSNKTDYYKYQDLNGSLSYYFSNGNQISMNLCYNPETEKINSLETNIIVNNGENQIFQIRPEYDFEEKEFSFYFETFFMR